MTTRIEMDAVVKEYALCMLKSVLYGPKRLLALRNENDDRVKERVFMSVLESMVRSGAANHRYDDKRKIDVFLASETLTQNWGSVFPGTMIPDDRSSRHILEISGSRSRYFKEGSFVADSAQAGALWPS
jgi:hypothetical protein